jgi:hypothetical protein
MDRVDRRLHGEDTEGQREAQGDCATPGAAGRQTQQCDTRHEPECRPEPAISHRAEIDVAGHGTPARVRVEQMRRGMRHDGGRHHHEGLRGERAQDR